MHFFLFLLLLFLYIKEYSSHNALFFVNVNVCALTCDRLTWIMIPAGVRPKACIHVFWFVSIDFKEKRIRVNRLFSFLFAASLVSRKSLALSWRTLFGHFLFFFSIQTKSGKVLPHAFWCLSGKWPGNQLALIGYNCEKLFGGAMQLCRGNPTWLVFQSYAESHKETELFCCTI